jgi:hypothetical protein
MADADGKTDADNDVGTTAKNILTGFFGLAFVVYAALDLAGAFVTPADRAVAALNRGIQHDNRGELDEASGR